MNGESVIEFSPPESKAAQEDKLVAMAYREAERQFLSGTISQSILIHFLKLGTVRAEAMLEQNRLENEYLREKIASAATTETLESMYDGVIAALQSYTVGGHDK